MSLGELIKLGAEAEGACGWSRDSLGLCLGIGDLSDVDAVLGVLDVVHLVHVGGGDGQRGAVAAEGQRGDAGGVTVELAQTLLVEGVPDVHEAVRAACQTGLRNKPLCEL